MKRCTNNEKKRAGLCPRCMGKFFLLLTVLAPGRAYAYLEPGSGSYFFQLFIASFLAVFFAVKLFWQKLKTWLHGRGQNLEKSKDGPQGEPGRTDDSSPGN